MLGGSAPLKRREGLLGPVEMRRTARTSPGEIGPDPLGIARIVRGGCRTPMRSQRPSREAYTTEVGFSTVPRRAAPNTEVEPAIVARKPATLE